MGFFSSIPTAGKAGCSLTFSFPWRDPQPPLFLGSATLGRGALLPNLMCPNCNFLLVFQCSARTSLETWTSIKALSSVSICSSHCFWDIAVKRGWVSSQTPSGSTACTRFCFLVTWCVGVWNSFWFLPETHGAGFHSSHGETFVHG